MFYSNKKIFCIFSTCCLISLFYPQNTLAEDERDDQYENIPYEDDQKSIISSPYNKSEIICVNQNDINKLNSALSLALDKAIAKLYNNLMNEIQLKQNSSETDQSLEEKINACEIYLRNSEKALEDLKNYLLHGGNQPLIQGSNMSLDNVQKKIDEVKNNFERMRQKLFKQFLKKTTNIDKLTKSELKQVTQDNKLYMDNKPNNKDDDNLDDNSELFNMNDPSLNPELAKNDMDLLLRMQNVVDFFRNYKNPIPIVKKLASNAHEIILKSIADIKEIQKEESISKNTSDMIRKSVEKAVYPYNLLIDALGSDYNFNKLDYNDLKMKFLKNQQNIDNKEDENSPTTNVNDPEISDLKEELNINLQNVSKIAAYPKASQVFSDMKASLKKLIEEDETKENYKLRLELLQKSLKDIQNDEIEFNKSSNLSNKNSRHSRSDKRKIFFKAVDKFNSTIISEYPNDIPKAESLLYAKPSEKTN